MADTGQPKDPRAYWVLEAKRFDEHCKVQTDGTCDPPVVEFDPVSALDVPTDYFQITDPGARFDSLLTRDEAIAKAVALNNDRLFLWDWEWAVVVRIKGVSCDDDAIIQFGPNQTEGFASCTWYRDLEAVRFTAAERALYPLAQPSDDVPENN